MDSSIPHILTSAADFDDRYIPGNRSTGEIGGSSRYPDYYIQAMDNDDTSIPHASTSTINNRGARQQVIRKNVCDTSYSTSTINKPQARRTWRNANGYILEPRVEGGYSVISPHCYEKGMTAVQYEEGGDIWAVLPETFGLQDESDPEENDIPTKAVKGVKSSKAARGLKRSFHEMQRTRPVPIHRGAVYIINVDGYYRKGCIEEGSIPKGGFGILIRRRNAESVVAKTGCAAVGKSEFYHTVEGIKRGLELVRMYPGITKLYISCNSDSVAFQVNQCFQSYKNGYCGVHPYATTSYGFCEFCLRFDHPMMDVDDFATICGYMKTIVELGMKYCRTSLVTNCERYLNKPADYLAKMQIDRGKESVFEPYQFPRELQALVKEMKKIGELRCYPQ